MATQSQSATKSKGGRTSKKTPGIAYDKTPYYIPESLALLFQLAEIFLKRKGDSICTTQALLEAAMANQVVGLCKRKGLTIQEMYMPGDNPDLSVELVKAMSHYQAQQEAAAAK